MLVNCIESCEEVQRRRRLDETATGSFYDIIEEDIDGDEIDFDSFRGSIVYIVNVASQCGYTAENYELFRSLSKYRSAGLEIVIAPCNQVTLLSYFSALRYHSAALRKSYKCTNRILLLQ